MIFNCFQTLSESNISQSAAIVKCCRSNSFNFVWNYQTFDSAFFKARGWNVLYIGRQLDVFHISALIENSTAESGYRIWQFHPCQGKSSKCIRIDFLQCFRKCNRGYLSSCKSIFSDFFHTGRNRQLSDKSGGIKGIFSDFR